MIALSVMSQFRVALSPEISVLLKLLSASGGLGVSA